MKSMLTTVDNPFNPFDELDDWINFDIEKGYYSFSLLARMTFDSESFSDEEQDNEDERVLDLIVKIHKGFYVKVKDSEDFKNLVKNKIITS